MKIRAFSLMELVLSLAICSILMMAVTEVYLSLAKTSAKLIDKLMLQKSAWSAMQYIQRQIRQTAGKARSFQVIGAKLGGEQLIINHTITLFIGHTTTQIDHTQPRFGLFVREMGKRRLEIEPFIHQLEFHVLKASSGIATTLTACGVQSKNCQQWQSVTAIPR